MAFIRRWWGWAVFVALLAGVGAALHAVLPPAPRLRIDGAVGVAVSDDGATLYTLDVSLDDKGLNGPLRIWETRTGKLQSSCTASKTKFGEMFEFSPDWIWLVYSSGAGIAKIVNLQGSTETEIDMNAVFKEVFGVEPGRFPSQLKAYFFGQNRFVCLHLSHQALAVVELSSGKVVHQTVAHQVLGIAGSPPTCWYQRIEPPKLFAFDLLERKLKSFPEGEEFRGISPDLSTFATVKQGTQGETGDIQLWDAATWKSKQRLQNVKLAVRLLFSPDSRLVALEPVFGAPVEIWEVATGKRVHTLPCGAWPHLDGVFSPGNRWFAGRDPAEPKRILFFDLQTGEQRGRMNDPHFDRSCTMRFPDDRHFLLFRSRADPQAEHWRCVENLSMTELRPDQPGDAFLRDLTPEKLKEGEVMLTLDGLQVIKVVRPEQQKQGEIGRALEKFKDWLPNAVFERYSEITTFDLVKGEESESLRSRGETAGFFAKDNATFVSIHAIEPVVEPVGAIWTCVWDVPFGRPWRWIVGVPLALGAALLGVRWTWRRWRASRPV
jgi:hypothetical protein